MTVGERFEVYNIGSEDYITVKEVVDIVVNVLELKNKKREICV